ncbi:MAG: hypothetical protein AABZ55_07570 [Bdellovibrionota bacterium]
MKKLIFLSILGLALNASAFAGTARYTCNKSYGRETHGKFTLKLNLVFPAGSSGSFAKLKVPGERGSRTLRCAIPAIEPSPGGFDRFHPLAFCNDPAADHGYSIAVRSGGIAGLTIARVEEKNYLSNKKVAELVCRSTSD